MDSLKSILLKDIEKKMKDDFHVDPFMQFTLDASISYIKNQEGLEKRILQSQKGVDYLFGNWKWWTEQLCQLPPAPLGLRYEPGAQFLPVSENQRKYLNQEFERLERECGYEHVIAVNL